MTQPLDHAWYQKLRRITAPVDETFTLLEPTADDLKNKRIEFEQSNYTAIPALFPDSHVADVLDIPYDELFKLRADIDRRETNDLVREVYLAYIDDTLANIEMIRAACRHDAVEYARLNHELYGEPDRQTFADVCDWIRKSAEAECESASDALCVLGEKVRTSLPDLGGDYTNLLPSDEVFQRMRALHYEPGGFFDTLFGRDGYPTEPYVPQIEGDVLCKNVLNNIGSSYVIADSPNNTWSVSRDPEVLYRPLGYRLSLDEFVGIVAHEIGSHIYESVNGASQPLQLFEMGLAGFLKGNEGRALLREQIVYTSAEVAMSQPAWEYNLLKHLAVSLALGYHNHRYTFPELYDTLYHIYRFWRERRYPLETNNDAFAHEQAWFLAVRIMKGTDGMGGCYQKDRVYLEGNLALWKIAETRPDIIMLGDQGKFNLLDKRQRALFAAVRKARS